MPAANDPDAGSLPAHVYPNWIMLAARVASGAQGRERQEWQEWARRHLTRPAPGSQQADRAIPCAGTRRAKRIGYMADD